MTAFAKFKKDFQGKRVLILGIGVLGRGVDVIRVFTQIGCRVTASDLKTGKALHASLAKLKGLPIRYRLGEHCQQDVLSCDVIIRNPAVPWHHPLLQLARKKNIPILMDTALFARYFPGTMIGITGTRGKTTTTMLIFKLLKATKPAKTILAGNSTTKANVSLLRDALRDKIAVMELSSWELQGFREEGKSPHIAVVTNIYEDHLNRYSNMKEYIADKEAIFAFQKNRDFIVLNQKNKWTKDMAKRAQSNVIWFSKKDFPTNWLLRLLGDHNRENAAAAFKVGTILRIDKKKMRAVFARFKGVPHRLEYVAQVKGVKFINDTTSTTPIATINALKALSSPTILLVGGNSKNLSLGDLAREISKQTKGVILLKGNGTSKLEDELKAYKEVTILAKDLNFAKSVKAAAKAAKPGDVVLLSPAFTSFAEFNNEFERGEEFRKIVKEIVKK
jgi:UDP-N-acetylmuramoylalanine--D-glutamate ligase